MKDISLYIKECTLFIFDVDDTLLYTYLNGYYKILKVAEQFNEKKLEFNEFKNKYGKLSFEECINYWYPSIDIDKFKKEYSLMSEKIPYKKVCNFNILQQKIKEKKRFVGILTNGIYDDKLFKKLKVANVDMNYIDYLYTRNNIKELKPSGLSFENIIKKSNISLDKIVYFGDSENDYLASKYAGIKFIAVNTGVNNWMHKSNIYWLQSVSLLIDIL